MNDVERAREFWDREVVAHAYTTWLDDPLVRETVVRRIGGWPLDWLERHLGGRRFPRALSIGCGAGALERDLLARGLCERIDAFDGSLQSVAIAKRERAEVGYFVADFNEPSLPHDTYDAVFFHQSLHHVAKLEKLLRGVLLALKPDGLLYLDEYVGPSSTSWTPQLARWQWMAWGLVRAEARKCHDLPYPIAPDDPSEAIRSGEILEQLAIGFDVVARQDYGGNVLAAVYPHVEWTGAPADLLPRIIALDEKHLDESYYSLIVARPKRGVAKQLASARYFVEPKVKRIGRMLR